MLHSSSHGIFLLFFLNRALSYAPASCKHCLGARTTTTTLRNPAELRDRRSPTVSATKDGDVLDLLDSNFANLFQSETPVLIDAYATFCGPCKLIAPVVEDCARRWSSSLTVSRWDVEAPHTNLKVELILQGVSPTKLPSLILVQKGEASMIHSGLIDSEELDELLNAHLKVANVNGNQPNSEKQPSKHLHEEEKHDSVGFISLAGQGGDDYMLKLGM